MNRLQLIKKLQDKLLYLKLKEVDEGVKCIFRVMAKTLVEGERIEIRNFGAFKIRVAPARPLAHNPRTNEPVSVPAKRKIHFKPGKELRNIVNNSPIDKQNG